MDRASAIRIIHSGRCPYPGDGRTNQPWPNRFLHRTTLLANESWTDRKGANDRDRGDLLFTIRLCSHSVVDCSLFAFALILWLLLWEQKRSSWLTFVVPWIFLGLGLLAKGPSHVLFLLSYRWRRSLAKSSPPRPNSPGALHWSRGNARNFCDLADSVLSDVTFSVAFASLVMRSGGRISGRRRQIRGLVTKLPPRLSLSTSLGTTSPVYSIE